MCDIFFLCIISNYSLTFDIYIAANDDETTNSILPTDSTPAKAINPLPDNDTSDSIPITPTNTSSESISPTTPSSPSSTKNNKQELTNNNASADNNAVCEPSVVSADTNKSNTESEKENNRRLEELYDIPVGK